MNLCFICAKQTQLGVYLTIILILHYSVVEEVFRSAVKVAIAHYNNTPLQMKVLHSSTEALLAKCIWIKSKSKSTHAE